MVERKFVKDSFVECCIRWARSISPRGDLRFWLWCVPLIGPFVFYAGEPTYQLVAKLSIVGGATLLAFWVSHITRMYFDEANELSALHLLMEQKAEGHKADRASILLAKAIMIAASWLARAIVMVGFLWAVVLVFQVEYAL